MTAEERLALIAGIHGSWDLGGRYGLRCKVCRQENGAAAPWPCETFVLASPDAQIGLDRQGGGDDG